MSSQVKSCCVTSFDYVTVRGGHLRFNFYYFFSFPSHHITSYHITSLHFTPHHFTSHHITSVYRLSRLLLLLVLSYPILSYPILSYPILSYPIHSNPIHSYPILAFPHFLASLSSAFCLISSNSPFISSISSSVLAVRFKISSRLL